MPVVYDERGEPTGDDLYQEPVAQASPQALPQQAVPFLGPSLQGRTDVIPSQGGGIIVPQGTGSFGPTPQDQRNVDTYLTQMAQAGRLDQAQKDVEQAMRFLGMRGVERDVEAGVPYPQALSKHLPYLSWGSPQQAQIYSKIIDAAAPPAPLSMTNVGGVNVLRTPRGDRIVPQSALPRPPITSITSIPIKDPEGNIIPGYFGAPSATGLGPTIHRRIETEPKLTPAQQRLALNDAIKDKQAEIDALPFVPAKDKEAFAARKQQLDQLNAEMTELRSQRPSALKKEKGSEDSKPKHSVPPRDKRVVGQVYHLPGGPKGEAGDYRWNGTGWERP